MPRIVPWFLRPAIGLALMMAPTGGAPTALGAAPAVTPAAAAPAGPTFQPIATPASGSSSEPGIASGPDGRVWLSWIEQLPGGRRALRASRLENAEWGTPVEIVSSDSLLAISVDAPSLLPLRGGRLAALYAWKGAGGREARDVRVVQSADGGATWSAPVTVNRDGTPTEHGFASLVPDTLGVRAIWLDARKSAVKEAGGKVTVLDEGVADMTVRTAVVTPEGRLVDERELDGRACDCCPTAAATDAHGALVAYRDRSPAEVRDISVLRLAPGALAAPRPVHDDRWTIRGCPVNGPAIAASGDRIAVAWFTAAGDTARVLAAFSDDGGSSFGPPLRVDAGAPLGRASVAVLADGGAIVSWLEARADSVRLLARRIGRSGRPSEITRVATLGPGRVGGTPRMTRRGAFVYLAWTEAGAIPRVRTAATVAEYSTTR